MKRKIAKTECIGYRHFYCEHIYVAGTALLATDLLFVMHAMTERLTCQTFKQFSSSIIQASVPTTTFGQ